jgi:EAL domain-containing protein (putative c-di-GMP-specific phosphodiesterase class I)
MDDFGVGQISLSYLHELPFQRLKIDRSFVREITAERTSHPIVDNLVRLGMDLGMSTLAEGIDRPEQVAVLRKLGCLEGQGYLFSRPVQADLVLAAIEASYGPLPEHCNDSLVMHA